MEILIHKFRENLENIGKPKKKKFKTTVKLLLLVLLKYILHPLIKCNHLKYIVQWALTVIDTHITTTTIKQ